MQNHLYLVSGLKEPQIALILCMRPVLGARKAKVV